MRACGGGQPHPGISCQGRPGLHVTPQLDPAPDPVVTGVAGKDQYDELEEQ
jgi:hypothetical protein